MNKLDLIIFNPSEKYANPDASRVARTRIYSKSIKTPLGYMRASSYESHLISLMFEDTLPDDTGDILDYDICKAFVYNYKDPPEENCQILEDLENELDAYFKGELFQFTIPFEAFVSPLEEKAFKALMKIPYGEVINYTQQTEMMGVSSNYTRTAASTNARNRILILMPCHRVIRKDNSYGGYNAGVERKVRLLEHEQLMRHKHPQAYEKYINAITQ